MRVCVVGCGAVGSLFAAHLAGLDDVEVWAYDLSQPHVDAINEGGLRLTGAGDVHARLRATTDAAELPACDFGIVATKAMQPNRNQHRADNTRPWISWPSPGKNRLQMAAMTLPAEPGPLLMRVLLGRGRP